MKYTFRIYSYAAVNQNIVKKRCAHTPLAHTNFVLIVAALFVIFAIVIVYVNLHLRQVATFKNTTAYSQMWRWFFKKKTVVLVLLSFFIVTD